MKESSLIQEFFYNNPDNYPPIVNGIRLLSRAGYKVELCCRDDGERWNVSYPPSTEVRRIAQHSGSWKSYLGFILRSLRASSGDSIIFIGHDMHGLITAWLSAKFRRRPFAYHCHDFSERSDSEPLGGRLVRFLERRVARTARFVVIPDADRAEFVSRQLSLTAQPLVVANAPLTRTLGSGSALRTALAERGKHFKKTVFRQGRIGVGHGIETTIESIPQWSNKNWGFVLMGIAENAFVKKLSQRARDLGVEDQVVFLPAVGYDKVCEFTPGATIGHALYDPIHINNIHIATASNKIMEYMEAGRPLLVYDNDGLRDIIQTHNCGLVVNQNSPSSIASAINTLLDDQLLADRLGQAARKAFEDVFAYERQFSSVLDAIESLNTSGRRSHLTYQELC